jgi:hypothetical protein
VRRGTARLPADASTWSTRHCADRRRRLCYATSRSLRLPSLTVDAAGIAPNQLLPRPEGETGFEAEIRTVQRVLESAPHR